VGQELTVEIAQVGYGGERIEAGDEWSAVRSGEGWPERERSISWSILLRVYVL
jgi:hypothetical protein